MFDTGFAMLFRAVDRIRAQLETADAEFRQVLAEELMCLQRLSDQYIDHWVALDARIQELMETFALSPHPEQLGSAVPASALCHAPAQAPATFPAPGSPPLPPDALPDEADPFPDLLPLLEEGLYPSWTEGEPEWPAAGERAFRKGLGYYDLLMYEQATAALAEAVAQTGHPVARLYLASAYTAQRRTAEALAELAEARAATDDPLLLCAADGIEAEVHWMEQRLDESLRCLLNLAKRTPQYADVWFNLGLCYARRDDLASAADALERSLQLNPSDVEAITSLVRIRLRQGDTRRALELCQEALRAFPHSTDLLAAYSTALHAAGEDERALRVCRKVLDVHPVHAECRSLLTALLWKLNQGGEAVASLKKQLTLQRNHPNGLLQLGLALLWREELDRAEQVLLHALGSHPDSSVVWLALGRLSAARGNSGQAYIRLTRAMKDPRREVKRLALYYYGVCLYEEGRWQESEKYLKAALVLGDGNPAVLIALARVTERLGRPHEAEKLFARAGRRART